MDKAAPVLITVQKFIYLLDDFHYGEFVDHLSNINAALPLKLAQAVRSKLPEFDTHEELCKKIYGSFEQGPKQNWNQLASYTLRLSSVFAQGYPNYLDHNIGKIQQLVNDGRGVEANFLADALLDIAERVNDFQCSILVLNFLSQQAFIVKDIPTGVRFDAELIKVSQKAKELSEIQIFTRKTLSAKSEKPELGKIKDYLLGFANDTSAVIRITSGISWLLILHQEDLCAFQKTGVTGLIGQLEKDMHNHSHVVFPYLEDLQHRLEKIKGKADTPVIGKRQRMK